MKSETNISKKHVADLLIAGRARDPGPGGHGRAPANIALCKYWGKRDEAINLPLTPSLSVALGELGAETVLEPIDAADDIFILNGAEVDMRCEAARRVVEYLDLFRPVGLRLRVDSRSSIPLAAGLASSASGFAALALALDDLFGWRLEHRALSIMARLGSGSACRSLYKGFAEWLAGERTDGMDSYAVPLADEWPAFRIALLEISVAPKEIGSRAAMRRTVATSELYRRWPARVAGDIAAIRAGIANRDLEQVGTTAEGNALAMHATMIDSRPAILYWKPESVAAMEQIWKLRAAGLKVFFTMDAGPNLKLIYEEGQSAEVRRHFPGLREVAPFGF
jgi:diphosphomevalonate decarboxylase